TTYLCGSNYKLVSVYVLIMFRISLLSIYIFIRSTYTRTTAISTLSLHDALPIYFQSGRSYPYASFLLTYEKHSIQAQQLHLDHPFLQYEYLMSSIFLTLMFSIFV